MLADFISHINEIMIQETNAWVSEFQSNLTELQKSINKKEESSKVSGFQSNLVELQKSYNKKLESLIPGNIKVNVTNTENFVNLKIRLDNNLGTVDFISPFHFFKDVKPGNHQVTVEGESSKTGQSIKATEVAHVEAGKVAEVVVNLE
jgi:hypothetical protein